MPKCSVVVKEWSSVTTEELYSLLKLRTDVFFVEQRIDEEELDNRDQEPTTEHFWIDDESGCAAYLRVLEDEVPVHLSAQHLIGRVVVRADRRGEGLAAMLLAEAVARHGSRELVLHAQEYVAPLYAKFGFEVYGEPFIEAGIPHLMMHRAASQKP
ncbi:MAG: GNAT family N-acetyltransferase [Microbacteriaceae bacterium]